MNHLNSIRFSLLAAISLLSFAGNAGASLVHRWSFEVDGSDSVGGADAIFAGGASASGGELQLSGSGAYATLPIDTTLSSLGSSTFETWASYDQLTNWARIFDFGDGAPTSSPGQGYLFLTGSPASFSQAQFSITPSNSSNSENIYAGGIPGPGVPLHYAVTIDNVARVGTVYINGAVLLSGTITLAPGNVVASDGMEHNWLGRSRFIGDTYMDGSIDEFRIYDIDLSSTEVMASYLLGPDAIPEPGTCGLVILSLLGAPGHRTRGR